MHVVADGLLALDLLALCLLCALHVRAQAADCRVCDQRTIQAHKIEEAYRDTIQAHLSEIADLRRRCDELTRLQAEAVQPGIVQRIQPRKPIERKPPDWEGQGVSMPPLG